MKNLILLIFIGLFSLYASAAVVISDLDDTIKMTNVDNMGRAIGNGLFSTKVFEPMPMVLRAMDQYVNGTYILSASPKILNFNIKKLLNKHDIPYRDLFTRTLSDLKDKKAYKLRMINSVIEDEKNIILIGDNVEADEEIYHEIKNRHPEKQFSIYIHKVTNKKVSAGSFKYYTAFEIAAGEYLVRRMEFSEVNAIAKEILLEKNMSKIIPRFAHCPTKMDEFTKLPFGKVQALGVLVQTKIIGYCKLRQQQ